MSGKYVFSKALKELRFHHCQTSDHSNAIRSFLTRAYPTMKHHNPHTPILIREAMNIQPRVFARYEFGKEKMADLQGMWERERDGERLSCHVKWEGKAARLLGAWTEVSGRELPARNEKRRDVSSRHQMRIEVDRDRLDDKAIEDKVSGLVQASQ
ncbi:hypothetical protein D0869_12632 [Hortaea werneckii]|uniref:Ribosomal protein/NADH dehydrogenase domain-containing protein n=2 Tax=Hortaea werneckii TaxID=91943 RepID=A0A3M6W7F9_HORWE|nr:hypothetical protein D0869_12632 [Hortaea werneckii]RMY12662.1 hypothetical protein D0868_02456 [Hortaea werneckii]